MRVRSWLLTPLRLLVLDRNQVFVKKGDEYRPAAFLLGKNVKAAAETTCQPAQAQVAHAD